MKDLYIVGAGGQGREVAWLVERINRANLTWRIVGFVDDNIDLQGCTINGYKIVGDVNYLTSVKGANVACAVGFSSARKQIVERLKSNTSLEFPTLIDPSVDVSSFVEIGKGTIICANTVLTVNIRIGDFCLVNPGCTIGHDSIFSDFVSVFPGVNVSGNTYYGECVELGTGSHIIQGKKVGKGTIVGAGATVVDDLPENCVAVGVPAKPIKFRRNID